MLVKTIMLTSDKLNVATLKSSLQEVLEIMDTNGFLSIPVVDGEKFKGIIEKQKIYQYYFNEDLSKNNLLNMKVEELIRKDIPIVSEEEEVEKAVALLERMNISFVAVVDDLNNFRGILTHRAVFKEFVNVLGLSKGEKITVRSHDVPGQVSKLSKIVAENNGDILSFVVLDTKSVTQVKEIIMRISNGDVYTIKRKLKEAGFKIV